MDDVDDLHGIDADAVDQHLVGMDHRFSGAGNATRTTEEVKLREPLGASFDQIEQTIGGVFVKTRNIVERRPDVGTRFGSPD